MHCSWHLKTLIRGSNTGVMMLSNFLIIKQQTKGKKNFNSLDEEGCKTRNEMSGHFLSNHVPSIN